MARFPDPLAFHPGHCLAAAALVLAGGCGLVDSDITHFALQLPAKTFTIDSANWGLTDATGTRVPAVDCSADPAICSLAAQTLCTGPAQCSGSCDGQYCRATVRVSQARGMDLAKEQPELAMIEKQRLVEVTIDRVTYEVIENTFTVATPMIEVHVGPQGAMTAVDPQTELIGTVAPIAAMTTLPRTEIQFTPAGRDILAKFIGDFRTPFQVFLVGHVALAAGDPIPMGVLRAVVRVHAHAGF